MWSILLDESMKFPESTSHINFSVYKKYVGFGAVAQKYRDTSGELIRDSDEYPCLLFQPL
jgi:hypothetical protein